MRHNRFSDFRWLDRVRTPLCVAFALTSLAMLSHVATASLYVTPGGAGTADGSSAANALAEILTGTQTSQAQINVAIAATLGGSTLLYKENVGDGFDSGPFASSYSTVYAPSADPSDGTISYGSGPKITGATHLLVKDGNHEPAWYLFDISGWDGMMDIVAFDFWPSRGAISHMTLYGGNGVIPEAGSLVVWTLLMGGASLVTGRRRRE
jgi:hypothetical protein